MRISELLTAMAEDLESPNNEALMLSEDNDECAKLVAEALVKAADILKAAAFEINSIEPQEESQIDESSIEEMASLASYLDESGDPALQKQASVIDELLLTVASNSQAIRDKKAEYDRKLDELKQKYEDPKKFMDENRKIADALKDIEKSNLTKQYEVLEAPLSTRYCPDHAGVQIARVGDHEWQCELDKKVYNFNNGFTLNNGSRVPGSSIQEQNRYLNSSSEALFSSREDRLTGYNR